MDDDDWEKWAYWLRDNGRPLFLSMDPRNNPQSLIENTKDACLKYCISIGLMFSTKRAMKERFDQKKRVLKAVRRKRGQTGEATPEMSFADFGRTYFNLDISALA